MARAQGRNIKQGLAVLGSSLPVNGRSYSTIHPIGPYHKFSPTPATMPHECYNKLNTLSEDSMKKVIITVASLLAIVGIILLNALDRKSVV